MFQNFRQSMAWLHTWFGLVIGFVLIVVFFFGSLSVFDREIDRWAIPGTLALALGCQLVLGPDLPELVVRGPSAQV